MRILIVTQYFWPESFRINDLALGLVGRGHKVSVLTGLPNYPSGKLFDGFGLKSLGSSEYQGIRVHRVPLIPRGSGKSWQLSLNYLSFVLFSCLLGPLLCRRKFDVVFVFEPSPFTVGLPGALLRRIKRAPMLFWVQDLWPESLSATGAVKSPLILRYVASIVRFIYRRCDRVLLQSRGFRRPAIAAGANEERVEYFPNWAEDLYQSPPRGLDDSNGEEMTKEKGFRIVFAGNLGAAQSLETLVAAANQLKQYEQIQWIIIGDGRREMWLREEIKKNNLNGRISLLGRKPLEQMPDYLAQADALLVTLRKDPIFSLTIPSKIQSYLAYGKPIVGALDGEGARIIKESGAGFAAPAQDSVSLAESVLKIYRMDEVNRNKMGEAGRAYYNKEFSREVLIERLEQIMEEVKTEGLCEF